MKVCLRFFLWIFLVSIKLEAQTIITRQIAQSSDDAEESLVDGSVNITDTSIEMTTGSTSQIVGFRFSNITIPQGSRILSASIQFTASAISSSNSTILIQGHASDNSPTFQATDNNLSNRVPTSELISWKNIPPWTVVGQNTLPQRSPSLLNIVQELVDRPGWTSGNAISIMMIGAGLRTTYAYDANNSDTDTPELRIVYNNGITYTSIDDGDWDDNNNWSLDLGITPCNCSPPDKIENGVTVIVRNDIVLQNENLLLEEGGAINISEGSLEVEKNIDIKKGAFFSASSSFIFSQDGNISNEGTFLNLFSCLSLDSGNFKNSSGLDNDGNEGVTGSGFVYLVNGNIENSGFWDVNITWCAENGSSDLPSGDEDCLAAEIGCDAINAQAEIEVTKTGPATISNGAQIIYTIAITNNGPDDANNVILSDIVPVEVTSPEFSQDGGTTWLPWPNTIIYPSISDGDTETLLIRGIISTTTNVTLSNTAVAFSDSRDNDNSNNVDSAITTFNAGVTTVITNRRITYRVK